MRILLAAAVWVIMVGGLWLYTVQRERPVRNEIPASPIEAMAAGSFSIALTPTFEATEDPFALTTDGARQDPIELVLNGRPLSIPDTDIGRGETVRLETVGPILEGPNELFVKASPPAAEAGLNHGLRVQVFQDQVVLAETTIWGGGGALVSGSLSFDQAPVQGGGHEH